MLSAISKTLRKNPFKGLVSFILDQSYIGTIYRETKRGKEKWNSETSRPLTHSIWLTGSVAKTVLYGGEQSHCKMAFVVLIVWIVSTVQTQHNLSSGSELWGISSMHWVLWTIRTCLSTRMPSIC